MTQWVGDKWRLKAGPQLGQTNSDEPTEASAKDHKACNHEAQPVADSNCWRFIAVTYPILCLSYRPNVTVAKRLEYLLTHTQREGERERDREGERESDRVG